jgi:hypothetical protein
VVRVHDRKSPLAAHDFQRVTLRIEQGGTTRELPLEWYGELLWRARVAAPAAGKLTARVEAVDAAGNASVGAPLELELK